MQDHLLHGGLLYRGKCYFTYLPSQIFLQQALMGNQQQSRQISASISGVAFASISRMISVVVFLFLQPEILHGLAVVSLDLFLCVAQVGAQLVGAAGAEGVGGEGELDLRPGHLPQLVNDIVHVLHKGFAVAMAGVALGAEQVMRAQYDAHAFFTPGIRFRMFRPSKQASTALMMAVGMKGRTQAETATDTVLWATITNRITPTI